MVAAPERPPRISEEAVTVLYVRVRVDGFFEEGAVWCPAAIACFAMIEQLGLFVACQQREDCRCYLNGTSLHDDPVAVTHGDFLAIFKSVFAAMLQPFQADLTETLWCLLCCVVLELCRRADLTGVGAGQHS